MTLHPRQSLIPFLSLALVLLSGAPLRAQLGLKSESGPKPAAVFPLKDWGTSAAFSGDGRKVAIGTYGKVLVVDAATRNVEREIAVKSGYVRGVAWLPDHSTLVTGCFQAVELWNVVDGKNVRALKVKGYANDVEVSHDGRLIAAATETGEVRLWDAADGSERAVIAVGKEPLWGAAFSGDGTLIAAAGGDDTRLSRPGVAKVFQAADGSEARALDVVPEKCATDVAFSPDGSTLYVADMNDRVTLFDLSTGVARGYFGKHGRPVNGVVPMKDGNRVVSGGGGRFQDGNLVKIWTAADGKELATLDHHKGKVARVALSPDESLLLTVSFDKTAALWNVSEVLAPAPKNKSLLEPQSETVRARNSWKLALGPQFAADLKFPDEGNFKRIGIIGLDTSHSTAFTREFNRLRKIDPKDLNAPQEPGFAQQPKELQGLRVTAAYPKGSEDIESSTSRVPAYTKEVESHNVKIVNSIDELLKDVDYVLLETNDGRPHLDQVLPVLKAGKPVFVDKPIAGSLADAIAIYEAARRYGTPVFSASSLRFKPGVAAVRSGKFGQVLGADAFSPCSLEKTHPDLYWYGIHGVETLFTAMGTGCKSVSRTSTTDFDVAVGTWDLGRVGTFRGIRGAKNGYGLTVFSKTTSEAVDLENPVKTKPAAEEQPKTSYFPLLVEIVRFFKTGQPPVSEEETLEIYAFMSAADESKRQGGAPVTLESVMTKARAEAAQTLRAKLK
jgi:WD40 repeat protein